MLNKYFLSLCLCFSLLVLVAERLRERENILVQISNGWGIQIDAAVWVGRVILVVRVLERCWGNMFGSNHQ